MIFDSHADINHRFYDRAPSPYDHAVLEYAFRQVFNSLKAALSRLSCIEIYCGYTAYAGSISPKLPSLRKYMTFISSVSAFEKT